MKRSLNGFLWIDVAGLELTEEDKEILAHPAVSGVILFARNYESLSQLKNLTHTIKQVSSQLTITVDQEGGRVQRFQTGFTKLPSMREWGARFIESPDHTKRDFSKLITVMTTELKNAGVDSSLLPVLDVDYHRNKVIAERSFHQDINVITELGSFMIDCLHQASFKAVGKHFPGHGWVLADSHLELPVDERPLDVIAMQDIQPFARLSHKLDAIMLAHIVCDKVSPLPICFSPYWIKTILRKQLNFQGVVMCDDLSMQAVACMGNYEDRARQALEAGCDVLLVCNSRAGVVEILDVAFQTDAR